MLGAAGGVGATTLALALATAADFPVRVVECCPPSASGLASASSAELGASSGWRRGLRDGVDHPILLERTATPVGSAAAVPLPHDADDFGRRVRVTFLDCGWAPDQIPDGGWLARAVAISPFVVVAAVATVPGLRRLEATLLTLGISSGDSRAQVPRARDRQGTPQEVVVGVLGSRRKRWTRQVAGCLGPTTRALDLDGALFALPVDRDLAVRGLTTAPLPTPLLCAAERLLQRLPVPRQSRIDDPHPHPPARPGGDETPS